MRISLDDYLPDYVEYVDEVYSRNTARQRKSYARKLTNYFVDNGLVLDTDDFYSSIDCIKRWMRGDGVNNTKASAIRDFLKFISKQDGVDTRTEEILLDMKGKLSMDRLKTTPGKNRSPTDKIRSKILDRGEIDRLRSAGTEFQKLVFEVLLQTGMRRGELAAITPGDIDFDSESHGATIEVTKTWSNGSVQNHPKTSAGNRTVNLTEEIAERLEVFVENRGFGEEGRIFGSGNNIYRALKELCRDAGVRVNKEGKIEFSPHDIRHNTLTYLIKDEYSIEKVQRYAGHSDIATTQIYVDVAQGLDVQDVILDVGK